MTKPTSDDSEDSQSELEKYFELIPEFIDVLRDILTPLPKGFRTNELASLLQLFGQVKLSQQYRNIQTGEPNDTSVLQRWKHRVKLAMKLSEEGLDRNESLISQLHFQVFIEVNKHRKEEYAQLQMIITNILTNRPDEEFIRTCLQLYHRIYEGSYRLSISYIRFLLELANNRELEISEFDDYKMAGVVKSLKSIARSTSISDAEKKLLSEGVNPTVRNAIAHGSSIPREGRVYLRDKGQRIDFGRDDMQPLISDILITSGGLLMGFWIAFIKHQQRMEKHVNHKYDIDDIRSVLSVVAKDYKFTLVECSLQPENLIKLKLKEVAPDAGKLSSSSTKYKDITFNVKIVDALPRKERVQEMIYANIPLFNSYRTAIIEVIAHDGSNKGKVSLDLEKLKVLRSEYKEPFEGIGGL